MSHKNLRKMKYYVINYGKLTHIKAIIIMTNEHFQITQTLNETLNRGFEVVIANKLLEEKIDTELLEIGKQVKISGFRPGKVPMNVLRSRYRDNVLRDALNETVEAALQAVIKQYDITPAMMPDIKVGEYKEGDDLTLSISIEIMPEIDEIDFSELSLEKAVITLDDETVNAEVKNITRMHRDLEDKGADAKAENGDVVNIDFKGYVDGTPFEGGEAQGFDLELGSNQFIDGFEAQLVGLKAGETKDVNVTFPENYGQANLSGKPAKFEVKINKVQTTKEVELNDDFASNMGFENIAKLQDVVRDMMKNQHEGLVRDYLKKKLFDALEAKCTFDVPNKMLQLEMQEIERQMQNNNEELDKAECEKIARRRVQLGIFLSTTAKKNGIQVTTEELNRALQARLAAYPNNQKQVIDFYRKNPERVQALSGPILEEKTVDFILSQAKLVEKSYSIQEFQKMEEAEMEALSSTKTATDKKKNSKKDAAA
jgi:trigger factor